MKSAMERYNESTEPIDAVNILPLGRFEPTTMTTPPILALQQMVLFVLFDLILYTPSTILQLNRDGSSWVEPVLS